ncbi:hypothetical protein MPRS_15100 [Mycobacterium paraseoulense]|nr:hypothetical protein [Mycobacterium paraseoulense]MCV7393954.1 hypothetical protein [Mycobacterium paraseoulense]BBZ70417.1 hypothetical protein MPRS_15100 [Mycobacterium paraseoulense]
MIRLIRPRSRTGDDADKVTGPETVTVETTPVEPVSDSSEASGTVASAEHDGTADQDDSTNGGQEEPTESATKRKAISWRAALVYAVLPGLAMLLAVGAGFLKWKDSSAHSADAARIESVRAATDSTIKMLSYRPDSVEADLGSARDRLTGSFRDAYIQLTRDVVIPGSKQRQISAVATVPAAASVSASPNHAVVLMFVNQTIMVGNDPPSSTASSVRVVLDKFNNRWLVSDFTPV